MTERWLCPPLENWGDVNAIRDCTAASDDDSSMKGVVSATLPQSQQQQHADVCATSSGFRGRTSDECYTTFPTYQQLTSVQRSIIARIIGMLDTEKDSVVITNPTQPHSPIVYVTHAWQDMCGYTMSEASGRNPRVTQGEGSDPETIRGMRKALSSEQACRVRLINYRGYNQEPFWNCLSVRI